MRYHQELCHPNDLWLTFHYLIRMTYCRVQGGRLIIKMSSYEYGDEIAGISNFHNSQWPFSASWDSCSLTWPLQWHHNDLDGVSNHRRLHCLLNCWFRRRSKKTPKPRVTGLCTGNSHVTRVEYFKWIMILDMQKFLPLEVNHWSI